MLVAAQPRYRQGDATHVPSPIFQFAVYCVAMLMAFLLSTLVASRVHLLRRLCTPAAQMREEVRQRAKTVFFDERLHHIVGACGIMIYISLYEEQAAIVADRHVLAKLGQETLDSWRTDLTDHLRRDGIIPALCHVIQRAGEKLGDVFPREMDDRNELADALVVME